MPGTLFRYFLRRHLTIIAWFLLGVTGLIYLVDFIEIASRRGDIPNFRLIDALLLTLIPLLSPQGWDYVFLLATPAVLLVVDRWRDLPLPWRVFAAVTMFFFSWTIFDVLGRWLYTRLTAINIISIAALALLVVIFAVRNRRLG